VRVKAPGGASDFYETTIHVGSTFPCTELGIRNAIAAGGGLHRFACSGPTTLVTEAEIPIDNDVMLDGQSELTLDGNDDHRLFTISSDTTAGLRGFVLTRGRGRRGGAIFNSGTLTLVETAVSGNASFNAALQFGAELAPLRHRLHQASEAIARG